MTVAPVALVLPDLFNAASVDCNGVESAWETQASWRHGHFGPKSAPRHRDFGPENVGVN